MEQNELRVMYNKRLEREKQCYISKQVQIDSSLLSRFKTGKIDLYPHLFKRLQPDSKARVYLVLSEVHLKKHFLHIR